MTLLGWVILAPLAVIDSVALAAAFLAILEAIWNRTPWSNGDRRFD